MQIRVFCLLLLQHVVLLENRIGGNSFKDVPNAHQCHLRSFFRSLANEKQTELILNSIHWENEKG